MDNSSLFFLVAVIAGGLFLLWMILYFIFISTSSKYTNTPTYPIPKQGINYTDKRVLGEF